MLITSTTNNHIKELVKLKQSKYRYKSGLYLVEGRHLVLEAFKAGVLEELLITEEEYFTLDTKMTSVSNEVMKVLTSLKTPTTMVGVCSIPSEIKMGKRILCLDDIQDPGNLGTIIRSAVGFNIDTILLSSGCVDLYNEKVIRATQGMHFHISIKKIDLKEQLIALKKEHYLIYGTNTQYGNNISKVTPPAKYALIMGNEGRGMSDAIYDLCDQMVYLDLNSKCESLNVAVATSIILYELGKKNNE